VEGSHHIAKISGTAIVLRFHPRLKFVDLSKVSRSMILLVAKCSQEH
jgi:hypothetical protein